jgi:hypothetical protein
MEAWGGGDSGVEAPSGGHVETPSTVVEDSGTTMATPSVAWRLRAVATLGGD